eukprot:1355080-Amorphochlora_amoeboformis.AAC.1
MATLEIAGDPRDCSKIRIPVLPGTYRYYPVLTVLPGTYRYYPVLPGNKDVTRYTTLPNFPTRFDCVREVWTVLEYSARAYHLNSSRIFCANIPLGPGSIHHNSSEIIQKV